MTTTINVKVHKEIKVQAEEMLQLVSFNIGQEEFGLGIQSIQEINRMVEITRVPNAPEFVSGVINLRGKVIPIIDLRKRFGFPPKESDRNTRIIVVELGEMVVGFIVDAVSEVLRIPRSITEPPPSIVAGIGSEYITAVAKLENRLLILLDLERILLDKEKLQLESTI
ncbi:MAG: purine-binding chemotaxis protein CheW [Ignavibacteriae bacterium]|nr:MAG: purine-binding chemotaxis protein CheW [Ignavibacteriota bacterium]